VVVRLVVDSLIRWYWWYGSDEEEEREEKELSGTDTWV